MFLAYLIRYWHLKKWIPLEFEPMTSRTPNLWSPPGLPIARHDCDAARPAFPYPYRPTSDDIVRLRTIFFMLYSDF